MYIWTFPWSRAGWSWACGRCPSAMSIRKSAHGQNQRIPHDEAHGELSFGRAGKSFSGACGVSDVCETRALMPCIPSTCSALSTDLEVARPLTVHLNSQKAITMERFGRPLIHVIPASTLAPVTTILTQQPGLAPAISTQLTHPLPPKRTMSRDESGRRGASRSASTERRHAKPRHDTYYSGPYNEYERERAGPSRGANAWGPPSPTTGPDYYEPLAPAQQKDTAPLPSVEQVEELAQYVLQRSG